MISIGQMESVLELDWIFILYENRFGHVLYGWIIGEIFFEKIVEIYY